MNIYKVTIDGMSQWIAAESFKDAFDNIDGNETLCDSDTEQILIQFIPAAKWDEKWIGDEDNATAPLKSLREAIAEAVYFPCLLACEL